MSISFCYHVSYGVCRRKLYVPSKYVSVVDMAIRQEFDMGVADRVILQVEDAIDFPGEWIDVVMEVDGIDLIYLLPDKGKLKVVQGMMFMRLCITLRNKIFATRMKCLFLE